MDLIGKVSNQENLGVRKLLTNLYSTTWFLLAKGSMKSSFC
jgi:hypothetical protein